MSMAGGYRVIDLANKPLSNFATVYPGIYDYIEASNKMCVVSGLFAGGVEYDDFAVLFTGGTTLNGKVTDSLELVITDEDKVTVVVKTPAQSMKFVDMTGLHIDENGLCDNVQTAFKMLNLIASKEPFYIKGLDASEYFGIGLNNATVMVTSSDYQSGNEGEIGFSLVSPNDAAMLVCGAIISSTGILFSKSSQISITS